jgi:hypothetical protein
MSFFEDVPPNLNQFTSFIPIRVDPKSVHINKTGEIINWSSMTGHHRETLSGKQLKTMILKRRKSFWTHSSCRYRGRYSAGFFVKSITGG